MQQGLQVEEKLDGANRKSAAASDGVRVIVHGKSCMLV